MNVRELCEALEKPLRLFECSEAPGGIRVRTPFLYPDGDYIDVFVVERDGGLEVTDYGEALGWLQMQLRNDQLSPKQRRLLDDVCLTLGVERFQGQLLRRVREEALADAVVAVAQAALRVADLWFTTRIRSVESTADEVNDWLLEREIPFERGVTQLGRSGRTWTVDFVTRTPKRTAFVFVLSAGARSAARRVTERVLASLYDLTHLSIVSPELRFVSLFDDTEDVWQEEDFKLLEELSSVALWSRPDEFEQLLRDGKLAHVYS